MVTQCIENKYTLHKCSTILLSTINIQAPGGGSGETTNYVNQIEGKPLAAESVERQHPQSLGVVPQAQSRSAESQSSL